VTPVVIPIPLSERPSYEGFFWSRDQKRLYYQRQNGTILERDVASGRERVVAPQSSAADRRCGPMTLSPDDRTIATCRANAATDSQALVLIPVDGGERRELQRVTYPQVFANNISWLPDGRGLFVGKATAPPKSVSSANMFALRDFVPRDPDGLNASGGACREWPSLKPPVVAAGAAGHERRPTSRRATPMTHADTPRRTRAYVQRE